jgi:hypothetical protein
MKLTEVTMNRIKFAQQRLQNHRELGSRSRLSVLEVAALLDIVNGQAGHESNQIADMIFGVYSKN